MNWLRLNLLAVLLLGALMACAPQGLAQEKREGQRQGRAGAREGRTGQARQDRVKMMTEELKLSEEQQAKLKVVFKEESEKRRAVQQDTALSQEGRRTKNRELAQTTQKKVKEILTTEQFEKWEKVRKERQDRAKRPQSNSGPAGTRVQP